MTDSLGSLMTEKRNPRTQNLDQMSVREMLAVINEEDRHVIDAVQEVLPQVERTVQLITQALKAGGRLFYVGAGTSGRLGVMDASECPPTFMVSPDLVQAVMAGGDQAFLKARENAEDSEEEGASDLERKGVTNKDVIIGITASGRTPYPIGALKYARKVGAQTISLSCNPSSEISAFATVPIEVVVGPEVLTGSTRLKAATAHKMILNMISTTVMVQMGKVYENLMIDVHASNYKLRERAKRILMEVTDAGYKEAEEALEQADYQVKPAIVMIEANLSLDAANALLQQHDGQLRRTIESQI